MFAIATPQTVELNATKYVDPAIPVDPAKPPPPPESHGTATFTHPTDDVSACRLTVTSKDKVWTFDFNVNGLVTSSTYEDDESRKAKAAAEKKAKDEAKAAADKLAAEQKAEAEGKPASTDPGWDAPVYKPEPV